MDSSTPPPDEDGDGYGADVDCDDLVETTHPGAPELCNLVDDDCDGTIDEGTDLMVADDFSTLSALWQLNGSARHDVSTQSLELTPDDLNRAGTAVWNGRRVFESFRIDAALTRQSTVREGADGMSVFWGESTSPEILGGPGGGFGIYPAPGVGNGYAVVWDSYFNEGVDDLGAPSLSLWKLRAGEIERLAGVAISWPEATAETWTVELEVDGTVTVARGGSVVLTHRIVDYVAIDGYWGFSAATGEFSEVHRIDDVDARVSGCRASGG